VTEETSLLGVQETTRPCARVFVSFSIASLFASGRLQLVGGGGGGGRWLAFCDELVWA
jgi:hypothetical protein